MRTLTIFRSALNIECTLRLDGVAHSVSTKAIIHHDVEHLLYGLDFSPSSEISIHRHTVIRHRALLPEGKVYLYKGDFNALCSTFNPQFDLSDWVKHFEPTLVGFKYAGKDFFLEFELQGRRVVNTQCLLAS